jgi:pyridoxal phosphate enzyme (YggS family)
LIAQRLAEVRARVDAACRSCGRSPSEVGLIAVSKTFPAAAVKEAWDAGQRAFGESYPQELRDKAPALPADIEWHFIGRLQSNKAKYVAPVAFRVHALESVAQAEALSAKTERTLSCLIAVNVGEEESKGGVRAGGLSQAVDEIGRVPRISVVGLMTLPPFREDPEEVAPFFEETRALLEAQRARGHAMRELSMGMSHDFGVAIRYGATWVRVGTAIFGGRG